MPVLRKTGAGSSGMLSLLWLFAGNDRLGSALDALGIETALPNVGLLGFLQPARQLALVRQVHRRGVGQLVDRVDAAEGLGRELTGPIPRRVP